MRYRGFVVALAVAALAGFTGCGEPDNVKNQTPNDQPIGAPSRAGKPADAPQQPGPGQQSKGRGAPLPSR